MSPGESLEKTTFTGYHDGTAQHSKRAEWISGERQKKLQICITPSAPNVQHLNSPKKCCTLGTLLHIGDIAQEKWDFLKNILVFDFFIFGLFFPLRKNHKTKNARKKVNLIVKREGLSLLETHSVRETTRILNIRYTMNLDPSTVLRWKQQKAKILKNVTTSKATEKKLKKTFHLVDQCQLNFESALIFIITLV